MLSTPPAFILSQDQTLVISSFPQDQLSGWSILFYCFPLLPKQRRIKKSFSRCSFFEFLSFKKFSRIVVYCLVIKVRLCSLSSDSLFSLSYPLSFVKNFFQVFLRFFQTSFCLAFSYESACIYYHVVFCLSRVFFHFFTIFLSLSTHITTALFIRQKIPFLPIYK